jgi:hypothetical protein
MLDKIVILSCRTKALFIFTDRAPFTLTSDVDVVPMLMWFLDCPHAKLALADDGNTVTGIEVRRDCDEITMKITMDNAA